MKLMTKREAQRKSLVRGRGGRWGGPKVHRAWCRYALDRGYHPISPLEITDDDVLCKVCQPTRYEP